MGTAHLAKLGISDESLNLGNPTAESEAGSGDGKALDPEKGSLGASSQDSLFGDASERSPAAAQLLGVAVLEFGIVFHRCGLATSSCDGLS